MENVGAGRPEIVLALVSPVGTDTVRVAEQLTRALDELVGYSAHTVRVSQLMTSALPNWEATPGTSRIRGLMDLGDLLRKRTNDPSFCAMLVVQAILAARQASTGQLWGTRRSVATIVHSLKHPAEVVRLREVYGRRVVVIGVSSDRAIRQATLIRELLGGDRSAEAEARATGEAAALMRRDERDETSKSGQRVRDAYALCDVHLPLDGGLTAAVRRLVRLLFGDPFITPSRDEQNTYYAEAAKFRSSAAGRQVGAAVVDTDGEVLVLGCNDVPAPGGGQNWDGDDPDSRDFGIGADANDQHKFAVARELLGALAQAGWLADEYSSMDPEKLAELSLESGQPAPLAKTRVSDLLEFGRIMHAEMAALMTAARRGTPVRGATMYTTTYPCHECMRLILGAGVATVVYVDPYPKSMVPELYGHQLAGSPDGSKLVLRPFVGIAPRMLPQVFRQVDQRLRDPRGNYITWMGKEAAFVGTDDRYADTTRLQEMAVGARLQASLDLLDSIDHTPES